MRKFDRSADLSGGSWCALAFTRTSSAPTTARERGVVPLAVHHSVARRPFGTRHVGASATSELAHAQPVHCAITPSANGLFLTRPRLQANGTTSRSQANFDRPNLRPQDRRSDECSKQLNGPTACDGAATCRRRDHNGDPSQPLGAVADCLRQHGAQLPIGLVAHHLIGCCQVC